MKFILVILSFLTLTGCVVYKPYPVYIHDVANPVYITNIIEVCDDRKRALELIRNDIISEMSSNVPIVGFDIDYKTGYNTNLAYWWKDFPKPYQFDYTAPYYRTNPFSGRVDKEYERK